MAKKVYRSPIKHSGITVDPTYEVEIEPSEMPGSDKWDAGDYTGYVDGQFTGKPDGEVDIYDYRYWLEFIDGNGNDETEPTTEADPGIGFGD